MWDQGTNKLFKWLNDKLRSITIWKYQPSAAKMKLEVYIGHAKIYHLKFWQWFTILKLHSKTVCRLNNYKYVIIWSYTDFRENYFRENYRKMYIHIWLKWTSIIFFLYWRVLKTLWTTVSEFSLEMLNKFCILYKNPGSIHRIFMYIWDVRRCYNIHIGLLKGLPIVVLLPCGTSPFTGLGQPL